MPIWTKPNRTSDRIEVPEKVIRRARLVPAGNERTWIEGSLAYIGQNVTHHKAGDPLLDEAIMGGETVLALLYEMRRREL